jgi:hypothetical protein
VTAAARVRFTLAAQRRRGVSFEEAWGRAVAAADREDWATALEWSKDEWRACYERRAGRFDALRQLEHDRGSSPRVVA